MHFGRWTRCAAEPTIPGWSPWGREDLVTLRINRNLVATDPPPLTSLMARATELRAAGQDVLVLAQAMVDYAPPAAFTRALAEALDRGDPALHHYAPDPGLPELRTQLAHYLGEGFGIRADPEREILVTPGANHAAFMALAALLEPGDEVLLPSPWYFNHEMSVRMLGARAVAIPADAREAYVPPVERIRAAWTPRTRVLALVNPNNPTGACCNGAWVEQLGTALVEDPRWQDVWLLADQTYQEIYFTPQRPVSCAAIPALRERTVTVGSFSKCFGLAGWRLGFLAGPAAFVAEVLKIQDSSVICAPYASQWALARTLGDPSIPGYLAEKRELLRGRRDALLAPLLADGELGDAGLEIVVPGGACFAFIALPAGLGGECFAGELLETGRVAAVSGASFGPAWTHHLRLSFGSGTRQVLTDGAGRITRLLRQRM
jgi:aspartate/methionine/tyrosine aminotransferase